MTTLRMSNSFASALRRRCGNWCISSTSITPGITKRTPTIPVLPCASPVAKRFCTTTQRRGVPDPAACQKLIGQPTPFTHPHLMSPGEVTPGISSSEYGARRTTLMRDLPTGSAVICLGYRVRYATGVVFYPFHQDTDMFYLCGLNEPDSAMVLERDDSEKGYRMTLFVRPTNPFKERWEGPRAGIEGAKSFFGADEAMDYGLFGAYLRELEKHASTIHVNNHLAGDGLTPDSGRLAIDALRRTPSSLLYRFLHQYSHLGPYLRRLASSFNKIRPLKNHVHARRLMKSPVEIRLMREAGEISANAFIQTMKATKPGVSEAVIAARMEYECRLQGAQALAYIPVVAGGQNALCIHYTLNNQLLRDGDLILVDAGALYNGYVADITRTWPVSGKFSEPQRELYQAVLNVQKACIKLCSEQSKLSLDGIHDASVKLLQRELKKLDIDVTEQELDTVYYRHHVGHYLGLDVHDTPTIDRRRRLQEGMVITIEPGLYVPYDSAVFPERYRGIGIRIEDNILVTREDPIVLSVSTPKEVSDIEFVMSDNLPKDRKE